MSSGPDIARLGTLIGDPARAAMLTALMDGRALTASELAGLAGVGAPTASSHLAQLLEGGLLAVEKQGRHRYFRLAGPDVAETLESLLGLAQAAGHVRFQPGPDDTDLRRARICYDHLAGELGITLHAALHAGGAFAVSPEGLVLSAAGRRALASLDIDGEALERARRPAVLTCLDWSERKHHLAGGTGAALLARFEALGWLRRRTGSRALQITRAGERDLPCWIERVGRD